MAEKIRLVRGDTGPQVRLTLCDEATGNAVDLTSAQVTLHFRAVGSSTVLVSRPLFVPTNTATQGIALIVWEEGDLDRPPGEYEGEIEIFWPTTGLRQTVYNVMKFKIREDFA